MSREFHSLCIVSPVFNEEQMLPKFLAEIGKLVLAIPGEVRLLLVDDGSVDRTWEIIQEAVKRLPWLAAIRLSRNFGHQAALSCGYRHASGDIVVSMDADLQDPPEVILEMIDEYKRGADVVVAVRCRRDTDTPFKRTTANLFYLLMEKLADIRSPRNAGDFRLLSRKALLALNQMQEDHRYLRGMVGWIGFPTATVTYARTARHAGETKFTIKKMFSFATDSLLSFSSAPLRSFYLFAFFLFAILFCYLAYSFTAVMLGQHVEVGWLSLITSIIIVGAINLLCLGIMGEYLGRIYMATKQRPIFIASEMIGMQTSTNETTHQESAT